MAPILRGVCLIMHGKMSEGCEGEEARRRRGASFCGWSLLQDSAAVCFDTCQLGHPVARLELLFRISFIITAEGKVHTTRVK